MCDFFLESHAGVTRVIGLGSSIGSHVQPGQLSVVLLQRWGGLTDCNNFVYWGVRGEPSLCSSLYFNLL